MQAHKLTKLATGYRRAAKMDWAQGLQSNGERQRSHMRPVSKDDNVQTGRLSPKAMNDRYLRALCLVNPEGARIEAFETLSIVEEAHPASSPEQVAIQVIKGALEAVSGLLTPGLSRDEREAKVLTGGAGFLAARVFVAQDPEPEPTTGRVVEWKQAA